jgi:protein-disulfide isomerase
MKALSPVANGIVSACALTALGLLLGRGVGQVARPSEREATPPRVQNWDALVDGGRSVGPPDARAVLVTFSDFQCPFCAALASTLATLRREQPHLVRMVYRHFPLTTIHPHAATAALAAECAADQGRFAEFHDLLYERQPEIGTIRWTDVAADAGVADTAAFNTCTGEQRHASRIRADVELGKLEGVDGTPTIFLNGARVPNGLSPDALVDLITKAARGTK